ncbi:OsmC family protein [Sporolactobacillus vineae]|uniref:OsmC family protein n=1 Tax=Sporolactobacillus vineae TaxID=444463 RepID=UPI000287DC8A|nr:OsmC family protein [Sporolactobacillus vineae]
MTLKAVDDGFVLNHEHGTMKINKSGDFRPGDLLEISIGACSAMTFRTLLDRRKIQYSELTVDTDKVRAKEEPLPIRKVGVHFTLKGTDLDEKLIRRLFNHVYSNCTIAQSVKGAIEVEETLDIVQEQTASR